MKCQNFSSQFSKKAVNTYFREKYYISQIFNKIRLNGIFISTENSFFANKFGLIPKEQDKFLSIMSWALIMHKGLICGRFIVASKKFCTKLILKAVSKALTLIFHQIQDPYNKSHFYSAFKQFWATENYKSESIN